MYGIKEIAEVIAEKNGISKASAYAQVVDVIGAISNAICDGENVGFRGFGSFMIKDQAEMVRRHIHTGELYTVPGKRTVKFKASKELKAAVQE